MTEENAAVAEQEVNTPPSEAGFSSEAQENTRDFEAEAREMGWVPKDEFKGDEGKWKPAQKFVEDGENILPIVRSQLKRTQDELAKKEADFAKRIERIERMSSQSIERLKAQKDAEIERIRREKREAVEAGDITRYELLDKQHETLARQDFDTEKAASDSPESLFKADNPWYGDDSTLTAFANGYSQDLLRKNPNITLSENLKMTAAAVKEAFPQKFGSKKPAANGHAAVDGGGAFMGAPKKGGKRSADLPSEARAAGLRFVKEGLFKDIEEYAKDYFGNE